MPLSREFQARLDAMTRKQFLETADARIGAVGALLEGQHASLFRVGGYTCDDWGAKIRITSFPMPGFNSEAGKSLEIGGCWEGFHTDAKRWQARYCWKFLFGEAEIKSVIAAGAEAATRGKLLTCSQVHQIFKWHMGLDDRKEKGLGYTELPDLMEMLFNPPSQPVPPPRTSTK